MESSKQVEDSSKAYVKAQLPNLKLKKKTQEEAQTQGIKRLKPIDTCMTE